MKGKSLMICLSLLAVPQTALGQSPAAAAGESEDDLSGAWLVTVHLTTSKPGVFGFSQTETHDCKGTITFVPTATEHYTASGQVNVAPKTDEERIYNVYFESCARGGEGHDIAKTSPHAYKCSYEYGEAKAGENGTATTAIYKMYRRQADDGQIRGQLKRWANRLAKIAAEVSRLASAKE
jgi:hypothetical protein